MYRNCIEKNQSFVLPQSSVISFVMVFTMRLKEWLKKCNYREYILRVKTKLSNSYKALKYEVLKGTSWAKTVKGTSECESCLFFSFETWLYFYTTMNVLLRTVVVGLFLVLFLGYIFINSWNILQIVGR